MKQAFDSRVASAEARLDARIAARALDEEHPWRKEPATKKQMDKLKYFGIELRRGATKGQASDLITKCVEANPEAEHNYQKRPATEAQIRRIKKLAKELDADVSDELDEGLTYEEAREVIQDLEST